MTVSVKGLLPAVTIRPQPLSFGLKMPLKPMAQYCVFKVEGIRSISKQSAGYRHVLKAHACRTPRQMGPEIQSSQELLGPGHSSR